MRLPAMLTSQIGAVLKQALTTFNTKQDMFNQNLEILKVLVEKTTAEDVNLPPQFLTDALWEHSSKAPVTYMDMYEDNNLTMGIFILRKGMKLPLHNHPHMHGIIKVIAGELKITTYSLNTDKTRQIDKPKGTPSLVNNPYASFINSKFVTAEKSGVTFVDINSECCLLEPERNNLHEIESVGGPAAFIDILAPPYETVIPGAGLRKCSYYSILREVAPNVFKLQEIPSPSWYWSDSFPYTGPELP